MGELNSFQVWIGINGEEDIAFVYGDVSDGDAGFLTVGAENAYGNSGENWYVNGTGTAVAAGDEVRINTMPGAPGASHQIKFEVTGWAPGPVEQLRRTHQRPIRRHQCHLRRRRNHTLKEKSREIREKRAIHLPTHFSISLLKLTTHNSQPTAFL